MQYNYVGKFMNPEVLVVAIIYDYVLLAIDIDNRVNERDWQWMLATGNASWDRIAYLSMTYGTHWSQLWSQLASSIFIYFRETSCQQRGKTSF